MIVYLFYTILGNLIALLIANRVLDGLSFTPGILAPLLVTLILIVLNGFVKPIIKIASLPLIFMSGGLILIVLNGFIFYAADKILEKLAYQNTDMIVADPLTYLLAAVIFGLANWSIHLVLRD